MATNSSKSVKGILKNSTSFENASVSQNDEKKMKWDEMNILATYHPPDKDYGHMKIDDPPTPYNRDEIGDEEDLDPESLAARLASTERRKSNRESTSGEDDIEDETPEQRDRRQSFEQKRKLHYNEFQAVKLARKLLEEEDNDDADDEDESDTKKGTVKNKKTTKK